MTPYHKWRSYYGQVVIMDDSIVRTLYYAVAYNDVHHIIVTSCEIDGMAEEIGRQMMMVGDDE